MPINGLFSCIHEGMLAFWRALRGYCTILSQGPWICAAYPHTPSYWGWYGMAGLPVNESSCYVSERLAKVLETGTTGMVTRGVSELLLVSESWWVEERRRQQGHGDRKEMNKTSRVKGETDSKSFTLRPLCTEDKTNKHTEKANFVALKTFHLNLLIPVVTQICNNMQQSEDFQHKSNVTLK